MIASFTATQRLGRHHHSRVDRVLDVLDPYGTYFTGGCIGGDSYIHHRLTELFPHSTRCVIWPSKLNKTDPTCANDATYNFYLHTEDIPKGWTWNKFRNHELILTTTTDKYTSVVDPNAPADTDRRLIAFPLHEERRTPYSGTWQTIRLARNEPLNLTLTLLDPRD